MKTIQQRLQSRISKRRNFIRYEEDALAMLKRQRRNIAFLVEGIGYDIDYSGINEEINDLRKELNALADDQRLDKKLKNIVVGLEYHFDAEIV